ncbi:TonB-dependent receptor [Roseateles violae]|uniref:TonB-dependent receptor n=1 Tax=Roseateles violae TaxID=3058042 RepID=A0ABT8DN65_9BURK|nr:TonB-dependent receptor [Pelomonas sp. PFR6]MDN3919383.1 TonB-dependent receptor [Pelomonas sp. PFR6]
MPRSIARHSRLRPTALASILLTTFGLPLAAQTVAPPAAPAGAPAEQAAVPSAAQAAAASSTPREVPVSLDQVVVTVQRRAETLQSVPLSVTALTGAQIKNANVNSPERLEQLVPGLRMGRSGSDVRPAMRGTYTENVSATSDPRFGVYVDDIYQSRTSQVPPMIDLARVEVQKGPQGTLYGRNSFGGNLVFHSALPTDELEGGIDLGFGNFLEHRAEGFVNVPLSKGIAMRIAALSERTHGYVENVGSGNDIGGESQKYIRGTLRIAPPSVRDLEVLLRASYQDLGGAGQGGFGQKYKGTLVDASLIRAPGESLTYNGITYQLPKGFNGNSFTGTPLPVDSRYRDGIPDINGADIGIPVSEDPYQVNFAGDIFRTGSQKNFGATLNYGNGPVRFRSITSFADFDLIRTGNSLTPVLLNYSYQQTLAKTYTQEFQLLSNDDKADALRWIVGAYFFDDTATDRSVTNVNRAYVAATAPPGQQYYPFGFTLLPSGTGLNQSTAFDSFSAYQQKARSTAGYGQLSYTLFDKLTLTGGLRYTRDEKNVLSARFNTSPTGPGAYFVHSIDDPVNYACGGFIAANAASVSQSQTAIDQAYNFVCAGNVYSYTNYRVAADYKFNADLMGYTSYSTGTHAGGFNSGAVTIGGVPTLLPFAPEKVKAFELGFKSTLLDRKLTLNAAAYVNDYRDLHAQTSIPNPNAPQTSVIALVQNVGKDRAYGFDIEAGFRPTRELRMSLAYNYLNAKQLDYGVNTFNFGGEASFCGITPSCVPGSGEQNTVQGTPFPNSRTDPNRFVPVLDANGNQVVSGGVPQYRYVLAGTGRDGTKYTAQRAFSPKHTLQFGMAYTLQLGGYGTLTPEFQTYYNSGYILTDLTPGYGNNEAFTKTDLRLTYQTSDGDYTVQLYVNNVEDEATISRAVYGNHRSLLVSYAPPRSYGARLSARF